MLRLLSSSRTLKFARTIKESLLKRVLVSTLLCAAVLLFTACEKKGPMETAGEKADQAARTIKNGGEKTPGDKVSDAASDAKKEVEKAADDVKK
jgi:predicted small lipoprotein YifL